MLYYRDSKGRLCRIPATKHPLGREKLLSDVSNQQAAMKAQLKASSPVLFVVK